MSTSYNKAIVSIIMGLLVILEQWIGWKDNETITSILAIVWAVLVYLVPNKEA